MKRMLELVRQRPRFGYRRIAGAAATRRLAGEREAGLSAVASGGTESAAKEAKTTTFGHERQRLSSAPRRVTRTTSGRGTSCSTGPTSGSPLKWLSIVDEYTRECLALKVDRSITSEDVIDTLAELFAMRGVPRHIRSDNGPEFIARAIQQWLGQVEVETLYIEPGSPGRTATPRASTAGCATSSWPRRCSRAWPRHGS